MPTKNFPATALAATAALLAVLSPLSVDSARAASVAAAKAEIRQATAPMRVGEDVYDVAYQIRAGDPSKPPVVFVHGWAAGGEVWRIQLEELETDRELIAIDLIGHGASDAPERLDYSMETLADSIKAVLDHLECKEATLVGHSNGTPTVRAFYNKYPGSTEALVAVDGALVQIFTAEQAAPLFGALEGEDWKMFLSMQIEGMAAAAFSDQQLKRLKDIALSTPQHVVVRTAKAGVADEIWTGKPISVPLLVVNAEAPFWQGGYEKKVRDLAPKLEYHVLDQATHYLLIDSSDRFNELLEDFLSRL